MKTLSRYALVLLGLAAPLALRAAEVAKASARTDVVFEQPEKFTDVKDSDFGTDKGRDATSIWPENMSRGAARNSPMCASSNRSIRPA